MSKITTSSKIGLACATALLAGCAGWTPYEQISDERVFASLAVGTANKQDVLKRLGPPAETSRVMLGNYEVWSYRYKQSGVWPSLMHAHFDEAGVLRMMQSGPDPRFDRSHFNQ